LLASRPTPKLEYHPLLSVRDCLFNIFAATPHIWRPPPPSATRGWAMPWWQVPTKRQKTPKTPHKFDSHQFRKSDQSICLCHCLSWLRQILIKDGREKRREIHGIKSQNERIHNFYLNRKQFPLKLQVWYPHSYATALVQLTMEQTS
jgi:hypothetical protein